MYVPHYLASPSHVRDGVQWLHSTCRLGNRSGRQFSSSEHEMLRIPPKLDEADRLDAYFGRRRLRVAKRLQLG